MTSAATSAPQPAEEKPSCGRTRGELDGFLKQADESEVRFERYFFTNDQAPPPFAKCGDVPLSVVRGGLTVLHSKSSVHTWFCNHGAVISC